MGPAVRIQNGCRLPQFSRTVSSDYCIKEILVTKLTFIAVNPDNELIKLILTNCALLETKTLSEISQYLNIINSISHKKTDPVIAS